MGWISKHPILSFLLAFFLLGIIIGFFKGINEQPVIDNEGSLVADVGDIFPTKGDFPTEWIIGDLEDARGNYSNANAAKHIKLHLGTGFSRNVIDIYGVLFNSSFQAVTYYKGVIDSNPVLRRGGYTKVDVGLGCTAYTEEKLLVELGYAYCAKHNVYLNLVVVSETNDAEKYLKEVSKLVLNKIR